jgi:hypothetical protein
MNKNREGELFDGESEILKGLEEAYLTAYPNPDRVGCPKPEVIEQIVTGETKLAVGSEIVHHLTHCSPCFRIFIDARNRSRARRRRDSILRRVGAVAAVVVLIAAAAVVWWDRSGRAPKEPVVARNTPPTSSSDVASIRLDLQTYSMERGESGAEIARPTLPRKPVKLSLALPVGFEVGAYEIRISREEDGPAVLSAAGTGRMIDNIVQLETTLDLSSLAPGLYFLGMRQPGMSWAHVQVLIK